MIDTHAHLNNQPYFDNIESVLAEAKEAGVTGIVIASSNLDDSKRSVDLAKRFPGFLFACVGIHPQQTDPDNHNPIETQLKQLRQLIESNRRYVFAVGETGLDYSPAPEGEKDRTEADQKDLFVGQIKIAVDYRLPLVIHTRDAFEDTANLITATATPSLKGVFHCYTGGKKRINRVIGLPGRWYFGFDGNLTYEEGLPTVVKNVPIDRIVIETDTPFLTPIPYRGQPNQPSYLFYIQEKIDFIFGKEMRSQLIDNSKNLFSLP